FGIASLVGVAVAALAWVIGGRLGASLSVQRALSSVVMGLSVAPCPLGSAPIPAGYVLLDVLRTSTRDPLVLLGVLLPEFSVPAAFGVMLSVFLMKSISLGEPRGRKPRIETSDLLD